MENLLRSKEYWRVVAEGYAEPRSNEQLTQVLRTNLAEMKLKDLKAKNYLFLSIDKHILKIITQKETAKQIWDAMKTKYQGNARVKRAQLQWLRRDFETLEMKSGETVTDYFRRVMVTVNNMRNCGETMPDVKTVEKIFRTMTESFNFVICSIEESKDLDTLSVDELQSSLLVHEQKLRRKNTEEQVLKVEHEQSDGRGRGRGRGSFIRGRGRGRGRGRTSLDKATVECYRCHQMGHFSWECTNEERAANYAEFDENEELLLMAHEDMKNTPIDGIRFLDSACSNHMTGTKEWFARLDRSYNHTVKVGSQRRR